MKRLLLLAAVAFLFATSSCRKDLTCECTSTISGTYTDQQGNPTSYSTGPSTTTKEYKKVKKSKMKTICGDTKSSSTSNSTGGNTLANSSSISETKCKIK